MSLPHDVRQSREFGLVEDGDEEMISVCSMLVADRLYGIDIRRISEVLGVKTLERVPLAPAYIGGVLPFRGEVLTVVSFRALLGLPSHVTSGSVLVLKGLDGEEPFGFMVDSVGAVVTLESNAFTANPPTLDDVGAALYSGAFAVAEGFFIQLDSQNLRPSNLCKTGLFQANQLPIKKIEEEMRCER